MHATISVIQVVLAGIRCDRHTCLYFKFLHVILHSMMSTYSPEPLIAVHRAFARRSCSGLAPFLLHPAAALQHPIPLID